MTLIPWILANGEQNALNKLRRNTEIMHSNPEQRQPKKCIGELGNPAMQPRPAVFGTGKRDEGGTPGRELDVGGGVGQPGGAPGEGRPTEVADPPRQLHNVVRDALLADGLRARGEGSWQDRHLSQKVLQRPREHNAWWMLTYHNGGNTELVRKSTSTECWVIMRHVDGYMHTSYLKKELLQKSCKKSCKNCEPMMRWEEPFGEKTTKFSSKFVCGNTKFLISVFLKICFTKTQKSE